MILYYCIYF